VRRHHGHAAALQMGGNDAGQPVDGCDVEGDKGFVEYPQWSPIDHQAGQGDAPLLTLRQVFAGEILAAGEADLLKGVDGVVLGQRIAGQTGSGEQVFERCQFFLDGVQVAEVTQRSMVFVALLADRLAVPADFTGCSACSPSTA
jgi:hypothetical protein